jgi:hypothetical protein
MLSGKAFYAGGQEGIFLSQGYLFPMNSPVFCSQSPRSAWLSTRLPALAQSRQKNFTQK